MNEQKKRISKKKEGLALSARQTSMLVASVCMAAVLVFLGGYVVGKKQSFAQVIAQIEHDSLADQIYASVCSLYEAESDHELGAHHEYHDQLAGETSALKCPVSTAQEKNEASLYVGQLLSYHIRPYADQFVQKMAKKNVPLEIRTRKSVATNGEVKEWYQVVTKPYEDRHELELVVEQVSQEEKITGAQIVMC